MRWRTAHKRARRPRGRSATPMTMDQIRRRLAWEAMRRRLAAGPIKWPSPGYFRREIDRLRLDPAAFAELVAPQFRRFVSHPAIIIEPKPSQRFPKIRFYDESGPIPAAVWDLGR